MEILCRRRKNNPVFVGDAGVGKTALAEGLATRLLDDDVPDLLEGAEVFSLDTGALLAGTRFRGDFEERFKAVIDALAKRPMPILFIDEIHSTVGAGATTGGTMDLATLIKPILTTGQLRVVGSTTHEEFKHIEKDRALARRLQKIDDRRAVEPGDGEDPAGAALALRRRTTACATPTRRSRRRPSWRRGTCATTSCPTARSTCSTKPARRPDARQRGSQDRRPTPTSARERRAVGEPIEITPPKIEEVVARMARIPAKQASSSDRDRLRTLEESLGRVVFGQEEAVGTVARAIKRSRAGLGQPERPAGCFLFTGPTGVGKTELAKQLAMHLGNEFIRYDMSEYMEKHAVARLIGAPPGYVGFEQGGLLVDAVRQHPYAVLLLDEIEKAHPDIFNILLQVMDHATLTDNNGRKADFRQVVLIMTSNAGSRELSAGSIGFCGVRAPTAHVLDARQKASQQRSKQAIEKVFSPEFRNRLDAIVSFGPLSPGVMETIVEKFILQLEAQLAERRVAITLEPEARAWLAEKGYDPVYGARPLARVIQTEVRDPLTDEILFGRLENGGTVTIALKDGKLAFKFERARAVRRVRHRPTRRLQHAPMNMTDKEHDIPVKVVDRRWWANPDARGARADARARRASRPTSRSSSSRSPRRTSRSRNTSTKYRQARASSRRARLRLRREISKDIERSRRDILAELLEVLDNLDRAVDSAQPAPSADALLQGVEMVRRQFLAKLEGLGVTPIESTGPAVRPGAPRSHQQRAGGVARSGRPGRRRRPQGYRIGDDVLRPAAVAVAKA